MLREMLDDGLGRMLLATLVLLVGLLAAGIYAIVQDGEQWEAFRVAHSCKVVARMAGETQLSYGAVFMPNGQLGTGLATSWTPNKTGWLCDDGVTYWR